MSLPDGVATGEELPSARMIARIRMVNATAAHRHTNP